MAGLFPLGSAALGAAGGASSGVTYSAQVSDGVGVGDGAEAVLRLRVLELLAANAALAEFAELQGTITETLVFGDLASLVHKALVAEGFTFGDDTAAQFTAIHIVSDALRLSGIVTSRLEAMQLVIAGIAVGELVDMWHKDQVTEGLAVGGGVQEALIAAAQLVEGILLGGVPNGSAVFGVVVTEQVALALETGTVLEAGMLVREAIALTLRLHAEGDERIGYCLNTETKALTRFTAWPFNSYGKMPGTDVYYGMTPDGIRRIFDGATSDDGAAIGARVRLAMNNLGTSREKRMTHAYLGYTATGELRVKAIVTGQDGQKEAYTYRLRAQGAGTPRPGRIGIGQGLKSVYWGFELEAIDGAAFEIDLIELLPILLDTRLNGEGGGLR